LLVHK